MSTLRFEATMAASGSITRRQRQTRGHLLEQIQGEGAPQQIELSRPEFVFGRAEDAEIKLSSQRASRHHATLKLRGTDVELTDHDSHNGIFLNGVRIYSAILRDGDIIQMADCAFIFREG